MPRDALFFCIIATILLLLLLSDFEKNIFLKFLIRLSNIIIWLLNIFS